jgi:hypothetical protein
MTAQDAFQSWLLYSAAIAGAVVTVAFVAAVLAVALSSRKREE